MKLGFVSKSDNQLLQYKGDYEDNGGEDTADGYDNIDHNVDDDDNDVDEAGDDAADDYGDNLNDDGDCRRRHLPRPRRDFNITSFDKKALIESLFWRFLTSL